MSEPFLLKHAFDERHVNDWYLEGIDEKANRSHRLSIDTSHFMRSFLNLRINGCGAGALQEQRDSASCEMRTLSIIVLCKRLQRQKRN